MSLNRNSDLDSCDMGAPNPVPFSVPATAAEYAAPAFITISEPVASGNEAIYCKDLRPKDMQPDVWVLMWDEFLHQFNTTDEALEDEEMDDEEKRDWRERFQSFLASTRLWIHAATTLPFWDQDTSPDFPPRPILEQSGNVSGDGIRVSTGSRNGFIHLHRWLNCDKGYYSELLDHIHEMHIPLGTLAHNLISEQTSFVGFQKLQDKITTDEFEWCVAAKCLLDPQREYNDPSDLAPVTVQQILLVSMVEVVCALLAQENEKKRLWYDLDKEWPIILCDQSNNSYLCNLLKTPRTRYNHDHHTSREVQEWTSAMFLNVVPSVYYELLHRQHPLHLHSNESIAFRRMLQTKLMKRMQAFQRKRKASD